MALPLSLFKTGQETVDVTETRYRYFPASFVWQKRQIRVDAVRRCWTTERRDVAGRLTELHHFRVRTPDGTFVLTHDLRRGRWTLEPDREADSRAA